MFSLTGRFYKLQNPDFQFREKRKALGKLVELHIYITESRSRIGHANWSMAAKQYPAAAVLCIMAMEEIQCLVFRGYTSKMPGSSGENKMSKTNSLDN